MRWLITADWQAKFSNLDACKRAHEQELSIIKKHEIEGHINLGDSKDDFNPVDIQVVEFVKERKEAIHEAVTYDIDLLGNHDMLGQYDSSKNWFNLFDSSTGTNIQTPQVLHLGNCVFSCLPFNRSSKKLIDGAEALFQQQKAFCSFCEGDGSSCSCNNSDKENLRRIQLFHCDVAGAKWNNLVPFKSESKVTLKRLHSDFYEWSFGGHIHKHQLLSKNAMFVGNPFCTDAGEIDQQKGFIVYDDETNTYKRIRSIVPGIFSWAYVKTHKPKLVPGTKIKATIDCTMSDNYHKALDKVATRIESKYPECIAYVTPKFKIAQSNETIEIDPDSNDYDKIRQYIRATAPEGLRKRIRELIQYTASVLGNATSSGAAQAGKIIFDNVHAENVLSFQTVDFSFRKRGILLVKGKNRDWEGHSNGSGKTNLLSLLPIALSGRTFKDQKSDAWASDRNTDRASVRLNVRDDRGRTFSIIRGRRPVKLKFIIDGSDDSKGRRHNGKKETQGLIEDTLGYNFETLANSVYIDSTLSNAFLTGTTADRARLIHNFQNMDRFKLAKDKIGKEISLLNKHQQEIETQREVAFELLSQLDKDIVKARRKSDRNITKLKQSKIDTKKNLVVYKKASRQLSQTFKHLESKSQLKIGQLTVQYSNLKKQASIVEAAMETKNEEYKTFPAQSKQCPHCSQVLTAEHKKVVLARLKKAAGAKKTELKKLTRTLSDVDKQIESLKLPIENLSIELDKIDVLVSRSEEKYTEAVNAFDYAKDEISEEKDDVRQLKRRHSKLVSDLSRIKRVLQHASAEHIFLKYAQDSMSRDGLPSFLNKLLCPQLNRAAEKYSEIFIDKEIQVIFDIEDGHITPSVINTHGGKTIASQSDGEAAWAGLITAFSIREIAIPTNLLILDEPGTGLDKESARMFGSRLSRLKDMFETIIVVTHNESICSALDGDNAITVVKKNKVSSLK